MSPAPQAQMQPSTEDSQLVKQTKSRKSRRVRGFTLFAAESSSLFMLRSTKPPQISRRLVRLLNNICEPIIHITPLCKSAFALPLSAAARYILIFFAATHGMCIVSRAAIQRGNSGQLFGRNQQATSFVPLAYWTVPGTAHDDELPHSQSHGA